jgi:hypothetical protein
MATAHLTSQLVATIPARLGLLADVTEAVRDAGVNISAISAYERDGVGHFLLVTSDNARAADALRRIEADVVPKTVVAIEMPDEPGALEAVARTIAEEEIDVSYCYGTAARGETTTVIFSTEDDEEVAGLF